MRISPRTPNAPATRPTRIRRSVMGISVPLPLAGRGQGWGCKLGACRDRASQPQYIEPTPPSPTPSPQGGRGSGLAAAASRASALAGLVLRALGAFVGDLGCGFDFGGGFLGRGFGGRFFSRSHRVLAGFGGGLLGSFLGRGRFGGG